MDHLTTTLHIERIKGLLLGLTFYFLLLTAQSQTKRVLFLGNSYTYANNLPQMIADVASSTGNNLIFDSSVPGGAFLCDQVMFQIYSGVPKIMNGGWDYVVLQDQSLAYTGYIPTYVNCAYRLDTIIKNYNPCAHTMFYVTWGRESGMTFGSYHAMDSVIESNYMLAADSLSFEATPVGAIWRYLRINHPSVDLFDADGSHPSLAGSYAAACGFYTTLFRKDPALITFNAGLSAVDAANIRNAAKVTVYDNFLNWNIGKYDYLVNDACLTSIQDLSNNPSVTIFANPFYFQTTIQTNTFFQNSTLTLINSFGKVVKQIENISGQTITLFRDNLPSGLYFLQLTWDNKYSSIKKLIITDN